MKLIIKLKKKIKKCMKCFNFKRNYFFFRDLKREIIEAGAGDGGRREAACLGLKIRPFVSKKAKKRVRDED